MRPVANRGFGLDAKELSHTTTVQNNGSSVEIGHGAVVIAAITSCTNTSNPSVMVGAGLLAKKAVEKGLTVPPFVKTSLAPGSRVVTDYFDRGTNCRNRWRSSDSKRSGMAAPLALATADRCRSQ
ncbi:MAG: aconitase family protein [Pirellulaceae bacterium]